jgi:hypothetical protein
MTPKITRETWVKFGYLAFLIVGAIYGLFRFKVMLQEGFTDDGVQNQLRNLYAIASDYSAKHGNQAIMRVNELDPTALYNAGLRPPLNGVFPSSITLGTPLKVTGVDGRRTVVFNPTK